MNKIFTPLKYLIVSLLIIFLIVFFYKQNKKENNFELNNIPFESINYKEALNPFSIEEENLILEQIETFPIAKEVWDILINFDYSKEVTAGIIGNMMVECGGNTLHLKPSIISKDGLYYGLCQWSKKYYYDAWNLNTEQQCSYLYNTLEDQVNIFGNNYKIRFNSEDFFNLNDEKQVALAFAKCYERCGRATYRDRMRCATIALEYFSK